MFWAPCYENLLQDESGELLYRFIIRKTHDFDVRFRSMAVETQFYYGPRLILYDSLIRQPTGKATMLRIYRSFAKREYARQFMDGKLYMNSLETFWWQGNNAQRDAMEGGSIQVSAAEIERLIPDFKGHVLYETRAIADGFRYCNVLCFSSQTLRIRCMRGISKPIARAVPMNARRGQRAVLREVLRASSCATCSSNWGSGR